MANEIKHSWAGSVLTITSNSGTSSANLQGPKGDMGPRGPQGPAGVVYDAEGNIIMEGYATEQFVVDLFGGIDLNSYATEAYVNEVVAAIPGTDLTDYATKEYVADEIANVEIDVDLDDYATKEYVDVQITNVATGGTIDLSNYATKSYVDNAAPAIDNYSIVLNNNGKLTTAIGGGYADYHAHYSIGQTFSELQGTIKITSTNPADLIPANTLVCFEFKYNDGTTDRLSGMTGPQFDNFVNSGLSQLYDTTVKGVGYIQPDLVGLAGQSTTDGITTYRQTLFFAKSDIYGDQILTEFSIVIGARAPGYTTIDASFIPVDGETIIIQDGKLTVVGGASIPSSEEVSY